MKVLVIPDLHNRVGFVGRLIDRVNPDLTIFLGDYFDSYDDDENDASATATWLRDSINTPNRIHLFGNHDVPYAYPWNGAVWCPGWNAKKNKAVNRIISRDLWNKLQFVHYEQGFLLSHAGFHIRNFAHPINGISVESILFNCSEIRHYLEAGTVCKYIRIGSDMGASGVGGCTWLRWYEFESIDGINQIVGHTPNVLVQSKNIPDLSGNSEFLSQNYNLDSFSLYYGIIEDGKFTYHSNDLVR